MGNPMNPLVWTSKSLRKISELAKEKGYNISHKLVGVILSEEGYSLQSNRKQTRVVLILTEMPNLSS